MKGKKGGKTTTADKKYAVNGVNGGGGGNYGTKGVSESKGSQPGPNGKFVGQTYTKNTYGVKGI